MRPGNNRKGEKRLRGVFGSDQKVNTELDSDQTETTRMLQNKNKTGQKNKQSICQTQIVAVRYANYRNKLWNLFLWEMQTQRRANITKSQMNGDVPQKRFGRLNRRGMELRGEFSTVKLPDSHWKALGDSWISDDRDGNGGPYWVLDFGDQLLFLMISLAMFIDKQQLLFLSCSILLWSNLWVNRSYG